MYSKIMVPVDLAHADRLEKAMQTAADLAGHYNIPVVYVGVTDTAPGPVAHTPKEFAGKLAAFASAQAAKHGHRATAHTVICHDPAVEMDSALLGAVDETGADLVVIASHIPGLVDYIWPSNGGGIAAHAKASVFVVRSL